MSDEPTTGSKFFDRVRELDAILKDAKTKIEDPRFPAEQFRDWYAKKWPGVKYALTETWDEDGYGGVMFSYWRGNECSTTFSEDDLPALKIAVEKAMEP